jgi:glutathionylspermidine synthase
LVEAVVLEVLEDKNLEVVKLNEKLDSNYLERIGFSWHTDDEGREFISDRVVKISEVEALTFYGASNELYDMFVEAGVYVIENNLLHEIGIPFNLQELVKLSWENDVHWHLYGRFDFAGGVDGVDLKLLEFNADTPTLLLETAIIQWAILKKNGFDESKQFNNIHYSLVENFKRLVTLEENIDRFDEYYEGWKILFSCVRGFKEDENTTLYLKSIAEEAGFECEFAYIDEVEFDEEGIYYQDREFEYLFKLIPWEDIAIEEGELASLLTQIVKNQKAIILNPAYTLMFQSKAMLKILWDLYPNHPLLLETSYEPLVGKKYVSKPIFGREGGNVKIFDENGKLVDNHDGEYENHKTIYQEFAKLNKDSENNHYQAGVFFAYEGCGLGFRTSKELILDDRSKFCGHLIEG